MNRIGIIGGMSYESTLYYYEQINRRVNRRAGGLTSADLVLRSVNFEEYHQLMTAGSWDAIAYKLNLEATDLVRKHKCEYIAIASNTMHKVADKIARPHKALKVLDKTLDVLTKSFMPTLATSPLVHIGDCTALKCALIGAKRILLLGTKFTMTEDFMRKRLESQGLVVMDTSDYVEEIEEIDRIIFEELCHGAVMPEAKEFMMNFVYQFPSDSDERPEAIVLGCTELNMILAPDEIDIPLVDSAAAHVEQLARFCLL